MNDQEFREQYKPLQVPAHFDKDGSVEDQTLFALAQLGQATADEVLTELKNLRQEDSADKALIAQVHGQLTEWYDKGLIAATHEEAGLRYSLQKITEANDGSVNPDLLAPGLD